MFKNSAHLLTLMKPALTLVYEDLLLTELQVAIQ